MSHAKRNKRKAVRIEGSTVNGEPRLLSAKNTVNIMETDKERTVHDRLGGRRE